MIETERLLLRGWRLEDAAAHNDLTTDPRVVATLGRAPTIDESVSVVARQQAGQAANGFCFWAAERREDGRFIGWCGLQPGKPPIEGEVEIGWTIAPDLWGQGYAREAAAAVLDWGWANTRLPRILAITTPGNRASWGLMERLGMTRVPGGEFDHPALAKGDPLRRHLTYVIERPASDAAVRAAAPAP